jgi:hypothetical protein
VSAAELRKAAETLRERAEKATPGPWRQEYSKASGDCVIDAESHNCLDSVARTTHFRSGLDAAYIATMHPGVGLALAEWLDQCADRLDRGHHAGSRHSHTIACLINGGAA